MVQFLSTNTFRESLSKLVAKPKNGYITAPADICECFINRDIDDIRQFGDKLIPQSNFFIIKFRIPNSHLKLSKSDGFRLIYYVSTKEKKVVFMDLYPKRGAMGLINISKDSVKRLVKELLEEMNELKLLEHDITNNIELVENKEEISAEVPAVVVATK